MTKAPTKADLVKTIKKQDATVRKLTKALNFEKDKLGATQAVATAYLKRIQEFEWETGRGPMPAGNAPPAKLPWDCLPNPYESTK